MVGKKKVYLLFIVVAVALCVFLLYVFRTKDYVAVCDDGIYFGMSEKAVERIKGTPEKVSNSSETYYTFYTFNETIYGYPVKSTYGFFAWLKLTEVSYSFEDIDYKTAEELTKTMGMLFYKAYSSRIGFYETELIEEQNSFEKSLGVNNNGIIIYCDFEYSEERLLVRVGKQS